MNEIDYYPELCEKLEKYLLSYLPANTSIKYSYNSTLATLVSEIEQGFNIKSSLSKSYLPKLKLDILFGIKSAETKEIVFVLFEVKYLKQLGLAEYSQLVGYLQVAKQINFGILLVVLKSNSTSQLSNDFSEIINMKNLPMEWQLLFSSTDKQYSFKSGICYYTPNNGIDWINTREINGISGFDELAQLISNNDKTNN